MEFEDPEPGETFDSRTSSRIQLVFVPGFGGQKLWRHQLNYFSDSFRTISFRPEKMNYETVRSETEKLLNSKRLDNAVLIGSDTANRVVQCFSTRKDVISVGMTNYSSSIPEIGPQMYGLADRMFGKPKLIGKLFMSDKTDYRVAKHLMKDTDLMDYGEYMSYADVEMRESLKNAVIIQSREDRFSSMKSARKLRPDVTVSEIGGGTFCYYEKPEEFNKALINFVNRLKNFAKSQEIREKREKNKSIKQFSGSRRERIEARK